MTTRLTAAGFVALALVATSCSGRARKSTPAPASRPSIVFLLADDLDVSEMAYMPNVKRLLADQGVSFSHDYVSASLCCPSRASILRGQYAHNTGVESNGSLNGGFETAYRLGIEQSTIGTWLHDAGYRTAYIGKYLNQYPDTARDTYVPPGWDEFDSAAVGDPYTEYNYTLNENGRLVHYGNRPSDYGTTVYVRKAERFIRAARNKPFFVYLNVYAPHQPATPAPEDRNLFPHATAPRTPSFNLDVPGKPRWLSDLKAQRAPGIASIDDLFRLRIRSLQAVDRGVAALVDTLRATHRLAATYFVFSSDNGFHLGQFRMPAGKETAYDTDIHVPLIVRGPGVPRGRTSDAIVGNIDVAPTLAQLAGVRTPRFVDGRSWAPTLHDPAVVPQERVAYLLEHWRESRAESFGTGPREPPDLDVGGKPPPSDVIDKSLPPPDIGFIPGYFGVRTKHYMYAEYSATSRELYMTDRDPYEIHNLASDPLQAPLVDRLHTLVARLRTCRADRCRTLENARVGI
jgi:arylsulfatase A-like enzyme